MNDMIIIGDDHSRIGDSRKSLNQNFEMKDIGVLSYFLGLEVSTAPDGYSLTKNKYASDLVSHAGLTDSKF